MADPDGTAARWTERWADRLPVLLLAFAGFVFAFGVVFMAWRDHSATGRCHDRDGKTWDSGQHCLLPSGRVVDTHDRIWPW